MPELPEVEVVKKSLERSITNLTIKSVQINDSSLRYKVNKKDLNQIIGLKVKNIKRRSKYLLFFFKDKEKELKKEIDKYIKVKTALI